MRSFSPRTDGDGPVVKVQVFDAQTKALHEPQAAAREQLSHQRVHAGKVAEESQDLLAGEDGGEALRLLGPECLDRLGHFLVQDLAIEEEEGLRGLVLSGSGDVLLDGQVGEKGFHLCCAHIGRMRLRVEEDEALDPKEVSLFRAVGGVFAA